MRKIKILMGIIWNLVLLSFFILVWLIFILISIIFAYKTFGHIGVFFLGIYASFILKQLVHDFITNSLNEKNLDNIEKFKCIHELFVSLIWAVFWGLVIILPFGFFSNDTLFPYLMSFAYWILFLIIFSFSTFPYIRSFPKIYDLKKEIKNPPDYDCENFKKSKFGKGIKSFHEEMLDKNIF